MSETPTFGRYAEIPFEKMSPEQQEGYKAMIEARGRLPGPTKIWVHNPKLAKVVGPFGAHFQPGIFAERARARDRRLHHHQPLAFGLPDGAHERLAKAAGLPAAKVEAILGGLPTSFDDKREQVVYEMAIALSNAPMGVARAVRPRGQGARPCRHHRRHHPDGPLHQRRDDARLLRRPGRRDGHGALRPERATHRR